MLAYRAGATIERGDSKPCFSCPPFTQSQLVLASRRLTKNRSRSPLSRLFWNASMLGIALVSIGVMDAVGTLPGPSLKPMYYLLADTGNQRTLAKSKTSPQSLSK
jgi:hypothetical protein